MTYETLRIDHFYNCDILFDLCKLNKKKKNIGYFANCTNVCFLI